MPRVLTALDLFCGGGGVSAGLVAAGFEVLGVDIEEQPEYPYAFVRNDALDFDLSGFDLVWASPPCQAFTAYKRRPAYVNSAPDLISETRNRLCDCPLWVIENVPGARSRLRCPVILCGSMFGLDVRRHRLFETSFTVPELQCNHSGQLPRFAPATNRNNLRSTVEVGVWRIPLRTQRRAMGIDWMSRAVLSQAIPPAYAEHIGRAAIAELCRQRAA